MDRSLGAATGMFGLGSTGGFIATKDQYGEGLGLKGRFLFGLRGKGLIVEEPLFAFAAG
jgi:hypothetical protein